jgi:DNA-binding NtrC family response regulator
MKEIQPNDADLTPPPVLIRAVKDVLLVDPDVDYLRAAQNALRFMADVEVSSKFAAARARLLSSRPPDLLVTNLRLQAYNGLHLVHMADGRTRCVVYSNYDDLLLAREVHAAGAFYERSAQLSCALAAYVRAMLPSHDRRNLTAGNRRQIPRGGRRCTDR